MATVRVPVVVVPVVIVGLYYIFAFCAFLLYVPTLPPVCCFTLLSACQLMLKVCALTKRVYPFGTKLGQLSEEMIIHKYQ